MIKSKIDLNTARQIAIEISLNGKRAVIKRKICFIIGITVGLIEIIFGLYFMIENVSFFKIAMPTIGLLLIILAIKVKDYQRIMLKKRDEYICKLMDPSFYSGIREYIFDSDGIAIVSELGYSKYYWKAFKEYGTIKEYIYVIRKDNMAVFANRNNLSKEEILELEQLLLNIKK